MLYALCVIQEPASVLTVFITLQFALFYYSSFFCCGFLIWTYMLKNRIVTGMTRGQRKPRGNEKKIRTSFMAYIGILSFLWDVANRWIKILVGEWGRGGIILYFSNFRWKVHHGVGSTTIQVLVLLLPIDKVGW